MRWRGNSATATTPDSDLQGWHTYYTIYMYCTLTSTSTNRCTGSAYMLFLGMEYLHGSAAHVDCNKVWGKETSKACTRCELRPVIRQVLHWTLHPTYLAHINGHWGVMPMVSNRGMSNEIFLVEAGIATSWQPPPKPLVNTQYIAWVE